MSTAFLLLVLAVAIVVAVVVHAFDVTRGNDLADIDEQFHAVACDILNRQVAGSQWQINSGITFRDSDRSPAVRAFFAKNVPVRQASLVKLKAKRDQQGCLPAAP